MHKLGTLGTILQSKDAVGQLRHYLAVQIDIDQWHRRHGQPKGQDYDKLASDTQAALLKQLGEHDILSEETIKEVSKSLTDRIKSLALNDSFTMVPHFQCPLPCEYNKKMYLQLLIASLVLNACILIAVVPFAIRVMRQEAQWKRESLIAPSQ
ncbi:hypothetical protein WR25_18425 [Diploscapter pachys]|uniref:Uncharacterized protein n=1 Tax=Diploscapter pachys TaxID=2018661 RepID=A0A2A2JCC6_9BILA|nr:hypothetical protein WR25_18425 [Diploscapter pachys]